MLGHILCYKYHTGFIIILFLTIDQAQLINWTNFILDIITNCIGVSFGSASYSLWTNLEKGKSRDFDILFLVCNGCLVIRVGQFWQATLRNIMNTNIHMILKTFPFPSRWLTGFSNIIGCSYGSQRFFRFFYKKKIRTTPNKESSR